MHKTAFRSKIYNPIAKIKSQVNGKCNRQRFIGNSSSVYTIWLTERFSISLIQEFHGTMRHHFCSSVINRLYLLSIPIRQICIKPKEQKCFHPYHLCQLQCQYCQYSTLLNYRSVLPLVDIRVSRKTIQFIVRGMEWGVSKVDLPLSVRQFPFYWLNLWHVYKSFRRPISRVSNYVS